MCGWLYFMNETKSDLPVLALCILWNNEAKWEFPLWKRRSVPAVMGGEGCSHRTLREKRPCQWHAVPNSGWQGFFRTRGFLQAGPSPRVGGGDTAPSSRRCLAVMIWGPSDGLENSGLLYVRAERRIVCSTSHAARAVYWEQADAETALRQAETNQRERLYSHTAKPHIQDRPFSPART